LQSPHPTNSARGGKVFDLLIPIEERHFQGKSPRDWRRGKEEIQGKGNEAHEGGLEGKRRNDRTLNHATHGKVGWVKETPFLEKRKSKRHGL